MKKTLLALTAALAAVFALNASAQTTGPGEDKAVKAAPATPDQKAAAKEARKEEGKKVSKTAVMSDTPSTTAKAKAATAEEKKVAAAKRKTEGAAASKDAKEKSGPAN